MSAEIVKVRAVRTRAAVLVVALSLGCSPKPSPSELVPAIDRALENELQGYTIHRALCGTRVLKIGIYDRQRHSWPVLARSCSHVFTPPDSLETFPDSVTAVYRLKRNEFGDWVAEFERWGEFPSSDD